MATLGLNDLRRHAEKTDGERLNAFIRKFLAPKISKDAKFLLMDGKTFIPDFIETTMSGNDWEYTKRSLRSRQDKEQFKRNILSPRVTELRLTKKNWDRIYIKATTSDPPLVKTEDFGGGAVGVGPESLGIRAETLITLGSQEEVQHLGQKVSVKCFTNADQIKKSIIHGMKTNKKVSLQIRKSFETWGEEDHLDKIHWSGYIPDNEKNQLGKYVGEVLTGIVGFKFRSAFKWRASDPLQSTTIKKFCVPTDAAFAGIDVFFILNNNTQIAISNKYGKGAAASFFNNILPYMMTDYDGPSGALNDLVILANNTTNNSPQLMERKGAPAKVILYKYGFKHILGDTTHGLNKSTVDSINNIIIDKSINPYSIYTAIKKKRKDIQEEQMATITSAVTEYLRHNHMKEAHDIIDNLPNSLTAFFARVTADRLNERKPLDHMIDILNGKDFWQANLNNTLWKKGEIDYTLFSSTSVKLEIIGSKGAINDIEMKQGMLNYKLDPKRGDEIINLPEL